MSKDKIKSKTFLSYVHLKQTLHCYRIEPHYPTCAEIFLHLEMFSGNVNSSNSSSSIEMEKYSEIRKRL